jgi:hypothetical protein
MKRKVKSKAQLRLDLEPIPIKTSPAPKAPPVRTPKKPAAPSLKPMDSPVAIALDFVYALMERIQKGRTKAFDDEQLKALQNLDAAQLKELNTRLRTSSETMKSAASGDAFCVECYSNFTKPQLKLCVEYYKAIGKLKPDAKATGEMKVRKTRKKKEIPPAVLVKKVLYLPSDTKTGVTSIEPAEMVGAAQLWVYDVKRRKLGCYTATNGGGLSVKGTSVQNYNEKTSNVKNIRNPEKQVREFVKGGAKYWDQINAVPQPISPRLNRETLILLAIPR